MTGPRISIALDHPAGGHVIATMPAPDRFTSPARLVVGQVRLDSGDSQPGRWRAWLWPKAGGELHTTQHCETLDAATPEVLAAKAQKRASQGAWWQ